MSNLRKTPEEKRHAILSKASEIVAEQGGTASTKEIAKSAGVSEGIIFKYFLNKENLLNEVYLFIREDLKKALIQGGFELHPKKDLPLPNVVLAEDASKTFWMDRQNRLIFKKRFQLFWNLYISWGLAHPTYIKTLERLTPTPHLTDETREKWMESFPIFQEFLGMWLMKPDGSPLLACWRNSFLNGAVMSIANHCIHAMADTKNEHRHRQCREMGFSFAWSGLINLIDTGDLNCICARSGKENIKLHKELDQTLHVCACGIALEN